MDSLNSIAGYVSEHSGVFIIIFGILSLLSIALALISAFNMHNLSRPFARIKSDAGNNIKVLPTMVKGIDDNTKAIDEMRVGVDSLFQSSRNYLKHVGLVRYDAFDDIGGQQSYSLCLLDGKKNGILITYLTGKNFTRSYAVRIEEGKHSRQLGEEEKKAYEAAAAGIE
jgi:hypothetical protein